MGYFYREPVNHDEWILNRAYEIFGGIPRVKLVAAGQSVPEVTLRNLRGAVSKQI